MSDINKIIEEVAKEHPYRVPGNRDSYDKYAEGWTDAVNRIDSMLHDEPDTSSEEKSEPTQTEQQTGEWVFKDGRWECSKCGCMVDMKNPLSYENEWSYLFCPHCGTKMPIAVQR